MRISAALAPCGRDLQDQFLRLETETMTEQVQSQQARPRPRLKRYSLNKLDRDPCRIFEIETRKICIFETETETETRKMIETETLTDISVASIYKRPVFKVRDQD